MSSSPDTHRSLVSPYPPHSGYPHQQQHQHAYLPPPAPQFRLPPIRTLSLPQTPGPSSAVNDTHHHAESWSSRSSIPGTPVPAPPAAARPGSAVASDGPAPASHSPYSHRGSFSSNNPPPSASSSSFNPPPLSSYPQQSPIPPPTAAPHQSSYAGQKRPHPSSARQALPTPPPTSTHFPPQSSHPVGHPPPSSHQGGYHAHPHERSGLSYPSQPPTQAPPPTNYYQQQQVHHSQYAPYPPPPGPAGPPPVATQYNPDPYGRAPPPPTPYGYPPPPPQYHPPTEYAQQPPYSGWPPAQQQPPQHHYPPQPQYGAPPPQQHPPYGGPPPMHVAAPGPAPPPAPAPAPGPPLAPAHQHASSSWTPIAPAPAAPTGRAPVTQAPPDKPLAQVLEHCQAIVAFATYYASRQNQTPPQYPSPQETREMVFRAEAVVQLLFQLAEEAKPHRKAMAQELASAKKRKMLSGEGLLNDKTNDTKTEDKDFGMSREAKLKFFGDNKEAMEQAEKDMRTITQKRTLSQGGILPSNKTKYKKRSRATPPGRCHSCFSTETPEWRRGPDGARTLCNACGLHYAKLMKRQGSALGSGVIITIPMLQSSTAKATPVPGRPSHNPAPQPGEPGAGPVASSSKNEEDVGEMHDESEEEDGSEDGSEPDEDEDERGRPYTHSRPVSRQDHRFEHEDSRAATPARPRSPPRPQPYHSPRTSSFAPPSSYGAYSGPIPDHHRPLSPTAPDSWGARQASSHVRAS